MKSIEYNKLIRDRIPEIIEKSGKEPIYRVAEGDELLYLLNAKLYEELNEYSESGDIEELADLYEVMLSILEYKGVPIGVFENIRVKKRDERGSFTKGYVLEEVRDLTNFQQKIKDMKLTIEFIRMIDVQAETVERYIREGKIVPDLEIHKSAKHTLRYFKEESIERYVKQFNWEFITPENIKDKFLQFVEKMDMSYSYKPVLLKAVFGNIDESGKVLIDDIVDYFIDYYRTRKENGLIVEKKKCLYLRNDYTRKEVEKNIFANPFKRFEDMNFMKRSKDVEYMEVNRNIVKKLTDHEIQWIVDHCDEKLREYYGE